MFISNSDNHTHFFFRLGLLIVFISSVVSCQRTNTNPESEIQYTEEPKLMIFAASSLGEVLTEIADSFAVKHPSKISFNFASSGTLARQIVQAAQPDLFISASQEWAQYIDSLGFVASNQLSEIAQNDLVLITPKDSEIKNINIDSTFNLLSILGKERLSIGDPMHVPSGLYAKQSLEYLAWYKAIESRILPAKDARSSLMVVEMGEVPLGMVYRTDAIQSNKVRIVGVFPKASHTPINYVAALIDSNTLAKEFYAYLSASEARAIWHKYGFKK